MANILYMTALGVNDQSIFGDCQCLDLVPRSSNSMLTPELPIEIWTYIFSFACMDTGVLSNAFPNISESYPSISGSPPSASIDQRTSSDLRLP